MIDIEEREFRQLRELGQKLHIPIPEAFLELEVRDQDGKVVQRHKQRSHSWTRNAYNFLFAVGLAPAPMTTANGLDILNIQDTTQEFAFYMPSGLRFDYEEHQYKAAVALDDVGIVVGDSATAFGFDQYILQGKIAEGTGAGQLSHQASVLDSVQDVALVKKAIYTRIFNNNSGATITVREVALYYSSKASNASFKGMVERTVLGSEVPVPNTGQLKVTYTVQLTYPE